VTENEKLRALLAEAQEALDPLAEGLPILMGRIDAALAEPVSDDFKRGAEAMREAAAKEVFSFYAWSKDNEATRTDIKNLAELIDALPVLEDK
jgi:hypothetical protein